MRRSKYDYQKTIRIADRGIENSPQTPWMVEFCNKAQMPKMTWGVCNRKQNIRSPYLASMNIPEPPI